MTSKISKKSPVISRKELLEIYYAQEEKGFRDPNHKKYSPAELTEQPFMNSAQVYKALKAAAKSGHSTVTVKFPETFALSIAEELESLDYMVNEVPKYLDPMAELDFTKYSISW